MYKIDVITLFSMSGDRNERSVTSSGGEKTHKITRGETKILNLMFIEKRFSQQRDLVRHPRTTLERNLLIVMFVRKDFLCKSTI